MHLRPLVCFLVCTAALSAQSGDGAQDHDHSIAPSQTIDGSVNPEQIKDSDAYRLYLVTVAESLVSISKEDSPVDMLEPIELGSADKAAAIDLLKAFKSKYDAMISRFNALAQESDAKGAQVDIKGFLTQRDALIESTRAELGGVLTPQGMIRFNDHVQREKKNMQIAIEDAQ